jgi:hypothetical protein
MSPTWTGRQPPTILNVVALRMRHSGRTINRHEGKGTRAAQPPTRGAVVQVPHLGGLHHHYERRAA